MFFKIFKYAVYSNISFTNSLGILIRSACTVTCCIYTIDVSLLSSVNNNMSTSHIKS